MKIKTYSELSRYDSFDDRFEYLSLKGTVGAKTFGHERYLNQRFYTSQEWRNVRHFVIARDEGLNLGVPGFEIYDKVIIHHMNPMMVGDLVDGNEDILNPEYLITTNHDTHNAIHYGDQSLLPKLHEPRRPGDTKLW